MSPPDGKQPHQVFEFVTVLLLEYHLIVPVRRGSIVLESHGGRITEPVRNGCCLVFPGLGFVVWASSETEIWVFTFRIWNGTNFPASITPCHPQVRLSLLGEMSPSGYTGHRKSKAQECWPEDPGLAIFSCKLIPFLKHILPEALN